MGMNELEELKRQIKGVTTSWIFRMSKVEWNLYSEAEATGKREDDLRESYPQLFVYALFNLEDEILLRGVEFVTPKICFLINRIYFDLFKHFCEHLNVVNK